MAHETEGVTDNVTVRFEADIRPYSLALAKLVAETDKALAKVERRVKVSLARANRRFPRALPGASDSSGRPPAVPTGEKPRNPMRTRPAGIPKPEAPQESKPKTVDQLIDQLENPGQLNDKLIKLLGFWR